MHLHSDDHHLYRVPEFDRFDWLEHGFGTRLTVNWPDHNRLAMLKQVHSADVVPAEGPTGYLGQGDALVTDRAGLLVAVRTADCVPILLVDPDHRAVAAVHAGWRGTAQQIVACAISEMGRRYGTVPASVLAAIGPSIGLCCYEVGPDVARKLAPWWPELTGVTGRVHVDLQNTNRRQLEDSGVRADRIFGGAPCTFCSGREFDSYRRDGEKSGRMVSAVGIRG